MAELDGGYKAFRKQVVADGPPETSIAKCGMSRTTPKKTVVAPGRIQTERIEELDTAMATRRGVDLRRRHLHAPEGEDPRHYGWWGDMDLAPHLLAVLALRMGSSAAEAIEPIHMFVHAYRHVVDDPALAQVALERAARRVHAQPGHAGLDRVRDRPAPAVEQLDEARIQGEAAVALLEEVGLKSEHLGRYPHE